MSRKRVNSSSYEVFETTMSRLENALSVGQIATFDVTTCAAEDSPQEVLDRNRDFDQIPVLQDGKIIGVLERPYGKGPTAAEAMRPLEVDMLVAAEEPIAHFIPCLRETPYYRLVLQGRQLNGIVTRSDLLKLPVRLLAFARVTHLELIMANLISARFPNDSWLVHLSDGQRKEIERHHKRLKKGRIDPARLEVSGLEHKYTVVSTLPNLAKTFDSDMAEIKDLRDQLAHAKDFVADEKALDSFITRLQSADRWIVELTKRLDEPMTEEQRVPDAETTGSP